MIKAAKKNLISIDLCIAGGGTHYNTITSFDTSL